MQQSASAAPSIKLSSFAGVLASLTAPASPPKPKSESAWNDDGLEDDVATLTYEHALRAHARYRPDLSEDSLPQIPVPAPINSRDAYSPSSVPTGAPAASSHCSPTSGDTELAARKDPSLALDRNLKCSSITIRMSHAECAQLRQRACEAGLTVSSYLRSCTFEAEALRAQVKATLEELRSGTSGQNKTDSPSSRISWFQRFLQFVVPRYGSRRVAGA